MMRSLYQLQIYKGNSIQASLPLTEKGYRAIMQLLAKHKDLWLEVLEKESK